MATITGAITTLDEEPRVADCIRSLRRVCEEIVVVDSLSGDRTVEIAREHGARVVLQEYLGDGPQKNVAVDHASHDWILSLDADERLDDEAVETIRSLDLDGAGAVAYAFRRKNHIGERWIRWAGYWPDVVGRLFDRRRTRWNDAAGHTRLLAPDPVLVPGHVLHYAFRNYDDFAQRTFKYSARGARMLDEAGRSAGFGSALGHGIGNFLKRYLVQRGVFGGLDGLTVSAIAAAGSYLKYARLAELRRDRRRAGAGGEPSGGS